MSPLVGALSVAVLATIAAAGVVAGFRRRDPVPVQPFADPLEDRRLALSRSLADLEDARATGALEDAEYRRLRSETDERIARVARAIEARSAPAAEAPPPERTRAAGRVPSWAVGLLLVAVVSSVVVSSLTRQSRSPAVAQAPADASDPFAFFEQRVRDHPNDLAARLDLAHRYLDAGRYRDAIAQYEVALRLSPRDAEAHAHVAQILFAGGRVDEALSAANTALRTAPDYPEGLFTRAIILLEGEDRPRQAIADLHRYLEVAPFGAERDAVQELIARARAELDGS